MVDVSDCLKAQIETDDVAILTCHALPNAAVVIPRNQLGRLRGVEGEAALQLQQQQFLGAGTLATGSQGHVYAEEA